MAILLIVALSAGFFAGLKITKDAMVYTCDEYLDEYNFYDFRIFSTIGFSKGDVAEFEALAEVNAAEGTVTLDALVEVDGKDQVIKLMAIPEKLNLPSFVSGRMPQAENECLADAERFDESDIGKKIIISSGNGQSTLSLLENKEYTIVGLVDTPLYLGIDRGTAGIGNGSINSFLYLPKENFLMDFYTEINVSLREEAEIYTDEYDNLVDDHKASITDLAGRLSNDRYNAILSSMGASAELLGFSAPEVYVLTRSENAGYVSFENDTSIISGVANIFPIFFIMIAILVCITTMTRMVDEERTQIGVLKAMGYSNSKIMAKYLLYAGSATVLGWALGFFICTWILPKIFWFAYRALYGFTDLLYYFSLPLALITLAVSLAGILGSTYISCKRELYDSAANLIRPRSAKNGRRILLERISPLWKRLNFLQKVTLRNMFRYKRRLIMMIVGISCCTALVVTAFGIRDSMVDIGSLQYGNVQKYNIEASFDEENMTDIEASLEKIDMVSSSLFVRSDKIEILGDKNMSSVNLLSFSDREAMTSFWDLHKKDEAVSLPKNSGEAVINNKIAEQMGLSAGDTIEIRCSDMKTYTLKIGGIFDNYIYNYVIISDQAYSELLGEWHPNMIMINTDGDIESTARALTDITGISSVSQLDIIKDNVNSALSCLNYIIWLVVAFSGALAFIVIYNLTNINLAERSREIATVEVLGFYPKETNSYILKENIILSVISSIIGLPLGWIFHKAVMSFVVIDTFAFNIHITLLSYVLSIVCTLSFAFIVNIFMRRHITKINMAESLKAVE
ncbi:MAG: ABC transporter permease [Clostridia bacterium]|nr:ABC transporter permease [Clostridia bacterium]